MKKESIIKLIYVLIFGISFAAIESSVVVYLRELFYPEGFNFPLKMMSGNIIKVEMWRELATMFLLISIALITGRTKNEKFAYFIFAFAIWDIFYYVFLYLFISWPENILVWDILFLLPTTWVGPVIAPVINSFTMIALAVVIIKICDIKQKVKINYLVWGFLIIGSFFVLYSYMEEYMRFILNKFSFKEIFDYSNIDQITNYATKYIPQNFMWIVFFIGVFLHFCAIAVLIKSHRK